MGSENQAFKVLDAIELRQYLSEYLEKVDPPRDWGKVERERVAARIVEALRSSGRRWSL